MFPNIELPWKEMYLTAFKATANSYLRCFTYKIINNVLYLDDILNILQNRILLIFKLYMGKRSFKFEWLNKKTSLKLRN